MTDIKGFVAGYLTGLINALERTKRPVVSTEAILGDLKDLLTAVEDINEEPDITELEEILGPEELLDVMCHMRKTMSEDAKDFILQRFMKGDI